MRQNKPTDEEVEQKNSELKTELLSDLSLRIEAVAWEELAEMMLNSARTMKKVHENMPEEIPEGVKEALASTGGKSLLFHALAEREMKRCRALLEKEGK